MHPTDEHLMAQVAAGDVDRFDDLVRRHWSSMLRVAVSKLKQTALAEEAVQEAFLSAFASRGTFNPQYSFRGWLWTILMNHCRGILKRESTRATRETSAIESVPVAADSAADSGLDRLLSAERTELLNQLLDELPEAQADALRLRFFAELKFDEIARVMDCSPNGAKLRVSTGLERLSAAVRRCSSLNLEKDQP